MPSKKRKAKRKVTNDKIKIAWIGGICLIIGAIGGPLVSALFKAPSPPANNVSGTNISHAVLVSGNQTGNNSVDDHSQKAQQTISVGGNNYGTVSATQYNSFGVDSNMVNKIASELAGLDDKTADIETLPDGRTVIGGAIVTTRPRVILKKAAEGNESFMRGDYVSALDRFREVINYFENQNSTSEGYAMQMGKNYFPDQVKAYCYGMAAQSALGLGSNSAAMSFAEKAVNLDSSARNQLILSKCEMILGVENLGGKNYESAFAFLNQAVHSFENAQRGPSYIVGIMWVTNSSGQREVKTGGEAARVPPEEISRLYFFAGLAALAQSRIDLALTYSQKSVMADNSNTNAVELLKHIQEIR